ncbi:hypothetical protein ACWIUD_09565 [Helicobacter sp. 23-1044]
MDCHYFALFDKVAKSRNDGINRRIYHATHRRFCELHKSRRISRKSHNLQLNLNADRIVV